MSTQKHLPHGILKSAFGVAAKLEPLKSKKDPLVAAFLGFAFGGIGLGPYLQSWTDFFIPWIMLVFLVILGGLPAIFAPCFWAIYGYRRVVTSNAKLDALRKPILDVEVVTHPPPFPAVRRQ